MVYSCIEDDYPLTLVKEEGGLRYYINSAALRFIPLDKMKEEGYEEYISLVDNNNSGYKR